MPVQTRTRILATLGPACSTLAQIRLAVQAGANAFRLNMSHGDEPTRTRWIRHIKRVRRELNRPVAILIDLRGPRIRLGKIEGKRELVPGQEIEVRAAAKEGRGTYLPIDYRRLLQDVEVGNRILIRDGRMELVVLEKDKRYLKCKVRKGGMIVSSQGVNLPDSEVSAPALSAKDRADIAFAVKHEADWLALSFVRSAADLKAVRRELKKYEIALPLIAKIEHPLGIRNLDEIIASANGVMVARGDLAVEMGLAKVPMLQKRIVAAAIQRAIPVIVATQMLESMIDEALPTRAEVSDVANAVLDGADCMMLSGETAVGKYPLETIRVMRRIAQTTEEGQFDGRWRLRPALRPDGGLGEGSAEMAIVNAAVYAAHFGQAKLMLAFTESGRSARLVSSFRSALPLVVLTSSERAFHRMALFWGARAGRIPKVRRIREMNRLASEFLEKRRLLSAEDKLVALTGTFAVSGATNTIRIIKFSQLAETSSKKS